jgi:hypothetical protein
VNEDIIVPEGAEAEFGDEPCIVDNDLQDPIERERYRLFYLQARAGGCSEAESDMAAADNLASEQMSCDVLIDGPIKVEWTELGEGYNGDYDEEDEDDEELLRFDTYIRIEALEENPERKHNIWGYPALTAQQLWDSYPDGWVPVEDGSWCTEFRASATPAQRLAGLQVLMKEFRQTLLDGDSFKGRATFMSRMSLADLPGMAQETV